MSYNKVNVNVSGPIQPTATYKTKILKDNHSFAFQVTEPNIKYVIKHNFDLGGETVTVPEGCLIEMDGGTISNGTMVGDHTILIYFQDFEDCIQDVTMQGTWKYNNPRDGIMTENIYDENLDETQKAFNARVQAALTEANRRAQAVIPLPDEEDLTTDGDHNIKLKNKVYAPAQFSGLGRNYLRKNIVEIALPFNGFVEGVTLEVEGLAVAPAAIYFDSTNGIFVAIDNLLDPKYYGTWLNGGAYNTEGTLADDGEFKNTTDDKYYKYDNGALTLISTPTTKNVLTQDMFSQANTVYNIQYDYDLMGESVEVPDGCVLEFDGGSLSNGTLSFVGTPNIVSDAKCFTNIKFAGDCICSFAPKLTWYVGEYPVNVLDTSIDNTDEIIDCMTCGTKNVWFPTDKFLHVTRTITLDKPICILTDNSTRIISESVLDLKYFRPCIFTHNIVTIFNYSLGKFAEDYISNQPFYIGQIRLFVNKEFNELTEESINTPVVNIVSNVPGKSQWGITLDCNIKCMNYGIQLEQEEITEGSPESGIVKTYNYTGVKISSDNGPISFVKINGDIYQCFYGVQLNKTNYWFTDVTIHGSTYCNYGVKATDGVSPVVVFNDHQPAPIPTRFHNHTGYIIAPSIFLYGYVWDTGSDSDECTWMNVEAMLYCTSSESTAITYPKKNGMKETNLNKMFPNPFIYKEFTAGESDVRKYPNLLYNGLTENAIITDLSYKVQFTDEDELVESLNTDRIINGHRLFNTDVLGYLPNVGLDSLNAAYTKKAYKKLEISFLFDNNAVTSSNAARNMHLLFGLVKRRNSVVKTADIVIETGSSNSNLNEIYRENWNSIVAYFPAYYKLNLETIGLLRYSRFTITVNCNDTVDQALPLLSIPCDLSDVGGLMSVERTTKPYLTAYNRGFNVFYNDIKKPLYWEGTDWVDANGIYQRFTFNKKANIVKGIRYSFSGISVGDIWTEAYHQSDWEACVRTNVKKDTLIVIDGNTTNNNYPICCLIDSSNNKVLDKINGYGGTYDYPKHLEIVAPSDCILIVDLLTYSFNPDYPYGNYSGIAPSVILYSNEPFADIEKGTKAERPSGWDINVGFKYMQVDQVNGTYPIWASAIDLVIGAVTWVKADGTNPDA